MLGNCSWMVASVGFAGTAGGGGGPIAVSAAAGIAAIGGTAGTAAGHGTASAHYAHKASHLRQAAAFNEPQLAHRELAIEGTNAGDRLALRLQSGNPAAGHNATSWRSSI